MDFKVDSVFPRLHLFPMARQPRFQYAGAVYHVMARGDGGKMVFNGREDHESFLHWLERVCGSHG